MCRNISISLFLFLFVFVACERNSGTSKVKSVGLSNFEYVSKQISMLEDTLETSYKRIMHNEIDTLPLHTIHLLEHNYERAFSLDRKNVAVSSYLDKLQQLYMQERKYALSIAWTDTLLLYYPKYKEKAALLLNAATTAEIYLKDNQKMHYYYTRLLREHPKLKKEVKEMVKFRIEKS
jgi:hypothetical protein